MPEKLKEIRKEKKMTQQELAKELNIDQSQIARYESGYLSLDAKLIKKICNIFDISADYLLGLKDKAS